MRLWMDFIAFEERVSQILLFIKLTIFFREKLEKIR